MSVRLLVLCATLACSLPALTAVLPQPVAGDRRVRTVLYEPDNVVTIYGAIGIATMIMFDKDEFVQDMDGGDSEAWHLGVVERKNGIFVKPKASSAATNINVVTTKRVYNFDMVLAKARQNGFMRVQFRYPPPAPVLPIPAALEKALVDKLLAALPVAANRRYTVQGSAEIAPIEAWDDGTSTYLRFAVNGGLPAIYSVGADGSEHLENINTSPAGLVQVQGVRPRFALRVGATVACLFNEGYDPATPAPATNTVSPQVMRIIKGARP
jgi:type IV secretion system protein VirB9